jgi:hypothetical protein
MHVPYACLCEWVRVMYAAAELERPALEANHETPQVMKSPPEGVKMVMRAICIMLDAWPSMVTAGKIKDEIMLKKVCWDEGIKPAAPSHVQVKCD